MNVVAGDLILLCLGSTPCAPCTLSLAAAIFTVFFLMIRGSSTCCHCHALGREIRPCSESDQVHSLASQQNDIYFSDFFSSLQLRARHNYFHRGPRNLSGKKEQNTVPAPVRKCVYSSISISASLQGATLVSKAQGNVHEYSRHHQIDEEDEYFFLSIKSSMKVVFFIFTFFHKTRDLMSLETCFTLFYFT